MANSNKTLIVKGFRNDCDRNSIPDFLVENIKGLEGVSVFTDHRPYIPSFSKTIYLNFSTPEHAQQAMSEIDRRESQFKQSVLFNDQAFCCFLQSNAPVPFAIRISDYADESEASLAERFKAFGVLNVPGLPSVKLGENNKSAIVNFTRFEDAKRVLDALQNKGLAVGINYSVKPNALPEFYTRLILRLTSHLHLADQGPCIPISVAADCAQQVLHNKQFRNPHCLHAHALIICSTHLTGGKRVLLQAATLAGSGSPAQNSPHPAIHFNEPRRPPRSSSAVTSSAWTRTASGCSAPPPPPPPPTVLHRRRRRWAAPTSRRSVRCHLAALRARAQTAQRGILVSPTGVGSGGTHTQLALVNFSQKEGTLLWGYGIPVSARARAHAQGGAPACASPQR